MNEARARRQGEYGTSKGELPPGVSVGELSPLFDFSRKPWLMLGQTLRQFVVAWTVLRHTKSNASWANRETGREWNLLDAACGYGELYTLLRDARKTKGAKFHYTGVDLDQEKLAVARLLRKAINVHELDIRLIDGLDEQPFDVVVSSETLEHLDKSDGVYFLQLIWEVLKPGGLLVMTVPTPKFSERTKHKYHLYEWPRRELLDELLHLEFDVLEHWPILLHKNDWPDELKHNRIPSDIVRPTAGVLSVTEEGMSTMVVARKHD